MTQKNMYFLRHGIAVARGTAGILEEKRPLTDEGRKKLIREAKGMAKLGIRLDAILSSPLTRAWQTAEVIQQNLPFAGKIEVEEELAPGGALERFLKKLQHRSEENILLTGHEPAMSDWIRDLLGCGTEGSIRMKKGACCRLLLDLADLPPDAELVFLAQPKLLRALG